MAEKKWNAFTKGKLGKEALDKIGTYQEAPGGGTPLGKGQKAPSKEWVADHRKMQPRDENGQFTYNSANAKKLEYGPSRGKTIPPFLRGVELTFAEKGQVLKTKDNEKWKYSISTIDMSVEEMVENCKNYIAGEGGFLGMGKGSTIDKKGRVSKAEKESGEGTVEGKKVDISKAGKSTQDAFAKATEEYGKNRKPIFATKEPKEVKEEEQASKVFGEDLTSKEEETNDVEFNASEIGANPQQQQEWLNKNKESIDKIKKAYPEITNAQIVSLVVSGKVKKLSDLI
jgi:hypothetical protein